MIPIFDAGHGSVIGGKAQTKGKRSPDWEHGVLLEGVVNRWIVNRVIEECDRNQVPYYHCSPEQKDISLKRRLRRVNDWHSLNSDIYLLSIHCNAGGGEGMEIYTTTGQDDSDKIAETIMTSIQQAIPTTRYRYDMSDGDKDKEKNFTMLIGSDCPSVLLEAGFMDLRADYFKLFNEQYLETFVDALYVAIKKLYDHGLSVQDRGEDSVS